MAAAMTPQKLSDIVVPAAVLLLLLGIGVNVGLAWAAAQQPQVRATVVVNRGTIETIGPCKLVPDASGNVLDYQLDAREITLALDCTPIHSDGFEGNP